jgi:cullin-associated NEDD8-dissociated protein 1
MIPISGHFTLYIRYNSVKALSQIMIDNINTMKEDDKSKIVTGLLSRLEVKEDSLEVKGVTVKEFSRLSKHLKEAEIVQIFSKIIKYITDPKTIGKDIYTTCIKAILKGMPGTSCETVGKIILPELTAGISSTSVEIKELCFDTFDDFINTFDYVLIKDSEKFIKNKDNIIKTAIQTIQIDNASLRKTVGDFLGNFSVILNKTQMSSLVAGLMERITVSQDIKQKIAFLNALNSVAKISAHKQGEYIPKILEILLEFTNVTYLTSNSENYDENNDLVEASLQIIETFILKNTQILKSYDEKIVTLALELMEYDPNYTYSEGAEETYDYNADWGDDYASGMVLGDDSSWKVRRGAVKVILSFAKSRMELNRLQIDNIITTLVKGLREHEENVKIDICLCLNTFLRNLIVEDKEENTRNT